MSFLKGNLSRKHKWQFAGVVLLVVAIFAWLTYEVAVGGPLANLMSNRDEIVAVVKSYGWLGPMVFIILQVLQTVAAPIPGMVTGIAGGYIFGMWGILWTLIGTSIGFYLVFLLARKLGRPFVEKIIKKELLDKFDFLLEKGGLWGFFLVFLIPGLPDDVVCYIAGLSKIPIRTLMVLVTLGRLPAVVGSNVIGAGLGDDSIVPVVVISVVTALLLALAYWKKDVVEKFIRAQSSKAKERIVDKKDEVKEAIIEKKDEVKEKVHKTKTAVRKTRKTARKSGPRKHVSKKSGKEKPSNE